MPPHYIYVIKLNSMVLELQLKCLEIENWTRSFTMRGMDREEIVYRIDEIYQPETLDEMEAYSEAILYARYGVLN
jgi:hypothetical protein